MEPATKKRKQAQGTLASGSQFHRLKAESPRLAAREPAREAPAGADKGDDEQPPSQTPAAQRLPRVSKFPSKAPSQPIDPRLRCPTYYKLTQNPRKTGRTRRRAKHRSFSKQRIYRSAVFA